MNIVTLELVNKLHPYLLKEGKHTIVRQVMENVFLPYFLLKPAEIQRNFRGHFSSHMDILTQYVMDGYIGTENELTLDFIQGIHRTIYHGLTSVKIQTTDGLGSFMVPGEFKVLQHAIPRLRSEGPHFMCTPPEKVREELARLMTYLHEENQDSIYEKVSRFFMTFTEIHPFPDDNGKMGLMLVDLILLKHDIYPFFMASYKDRNKWPYYEMVQAYTNRTNTSMDPFFGMIEEAYAHVYEQKRMADFYTESPEFFVNFLENTDEKQVLSGKLIDLLGTRYRDRNSLVISDVGAGAGVVARDIITHLRGSRKSFQYNYLEPSRALIEHFIKDFDCTNVVFYEGNIEYARLPKSDIIIVSHVLQYIDDVEGILSGLIQSLCPGGLILIVQPSAQSQEMLLKDAIGMRYSTNINKVFPVLQSLKESVSYEQVQSHIYHMDDIYALNTNGQGMVSFFYNKPFDIIRDTEISRIQNALRELGVEDIITKEENYIWIEKACV